MTTIYPAQIDNPTTLPLVIDGITPISASVINQLRGAILNIETELGVKPSGPYATVRGRLDILENAISSGGGGGSVIFANDISGNSIAQTVIGLQGRPISNSVPFTNQVLQWNGSSWTPGTLTTFTAGNDLSGSINSQTVIGLQGRPVANTAPSSNQVLGWNGSAWAPSSFSGFTAGTDLSGSSTNQTVIGLQGRALSGTAPSTNQFIGWSGSTWTPTTVSNITVGTIFTSTATTYTTLTTDDLILVNSNSSSITVNLLASPSAGRRYRVKDSTGNAAINNIIISGNGNNIDGVSTYTIAINYGLLDIVYNGTQWNVI